MSVSAPRLYELEARQRLGADSRSAALRNPPDERSRVEDEIDTAGCNYVKQSRSEEGVLDSIQPDIDEEF